MACELVQYYKTVGRALTAANFQWTEVMKKIKIQWKDLTGKKRKDETETLKISKSLNIMKRSNDFCDILYRYILIQNVPIIYVII